MRNVEILHKSLSFRSLGSQLVALQFGELSERRTAHRLRDLSQWGCYVERRKILNPFYRFFVFRLFVVDGLVRRTMRYPGGQTNLDVRCIRVSPDAAKGMARPAGIVLDTAP